MENNNICETLEESAVDSAREAEQNTIKMATSQKAQAVVPSLLERRFHPIGVRDSNSVINLLLIQLYLLRCELASRDSDRESVGQLKQQIKQLQKEKKICTEKYEELYQINEQWSIDYAELNDRLGNVSKGDSSLLPCQQCVSMERQLNEKTELIKDLNASYEKAKVSNEDLKQQLYEHEKLVQNITDECKALQLQLEEYGDIKTASREKQEKENLLHQLKMYKSKYSAAESDRAQIQTQLNRLRHSIRQLLFESYPASHQYYKPIPTKPMGTYDHTHRQGHAYYAPAKTSKNHYHPTTSHYYNHTRSKYDRTAEYSVSPQQFAPRTVERQDLHFGSTNGEQLPPTPPGLLSRGSVENDRSRPPQYNYHPYKPLDITEQVTGISSAPQSTSTPPGGVTSGFRSVQNGFGNYLDLPSSPLTDVDMSVQRPYSAPGSLLLQRRKSSSLNSLKLEDDTISEASIGSNPDLSNSSKPHPKSQPLATPEMKLANGTNEPLYCSHCGASFPRRSDSYDIWCDHVINCTESY